MYLNFNFNQIQMGTLAVLGVSQKHTRGAEEKEKRGFKAMLPSISADTFFVGSKSASSRIGLFCFLITIFSF